jgi:hypothetical protein
MTRWLAVVVVALGLVVTSSVLAQSADAIIKRQEARFAALKSGQGREQFYSRDYISINPPGGVVTGYKPTAQSNPAIYVKDIKVIAVTANGAVLTHLQGPRPAAAQVPSKTDPDRFLEVWANEQGTWRVVARQGVWVRPPDQVKPPPRVKAPSVMPSQLKGDEAEILKAHQAIEDAFMRHDATAYERLTVPEFVRIGELGQMVPRADWVKTNVIGKKEVARVLPLLDDVRIRVYGDVAVMTHRHIARDAEGTTPGRPTRMMRAWVRRPDGWKLAATITTIVWPAQS